MIASVMDRQPRIFPVLLVLMFALLFLCLLVETDSLWGVGHLRYLPVWFRLIAATISALAIALVAFPNLFHGNAHRPPLAEGSIPVLLCITVSVGVSIVLSFLQGGFYLLGDGSLIAYEFSHGSTYYARFTEVGSYWLTRAVMSWTSGASFPAQMAFRIVGAVSGCAAIFFSLRIVALLETERRRQLVMLSTLICSGVVLQFCGYVEFYAPVWAASTAFLYFALRFLLTGERRLWAVMIWLLACAMHLIALVFAPAVLYLLLLPNQPKAGLDRRRQLVFAMVAIVGLALTLGVASAARTPYLAKVLLSPWGEPGKMVAYGVFTPNHLTDLPNLLLLIYPGALCVMGALWSVRNRLPWDRAVTFLVLASIGSLTFLLLVDPVLGMARDWDLMSLTVLPPMILLLYWLAKARFVVSWRIAAAYALLCMLATGMFLTVYQSEAGAVDRQLDLLTRYGDKDRGGWTILEQYTRSMGFTDRTARTLSAMDKYFPNFRQYRLATEALRDGDFVTARAIGLQLVASDSTQGDFSELLGCAFQAMDSLSQAEYWFSSSAAINPYHDVLAELASVYLIERKFDLAYASAQRAHAMSPGTTAITELLVQAATQANHLEQARAIDDSLLVENPASATAHLLGIDICLRQADTLGARNHFKIFQAAGRGRPGYDAIMKAFDFLR